MKKHQILIALFPLLALPCSAALNISVQAGQLMNASSTLVSDTSLWAIVYDEDGNGVLPGGLTYNSNLTIGNADAIWASFGGQSIVTGGTLGLDKILWAGAVDSAGTSGTDGVAQHILTSFTFASLGVAANGKWAIYWFPGLTIGSNTLPGVNIEVGGIQRTAAVDGSIGMTFPAADTPGGSFAAAFLDTETNDGGIPQSNFTAVLVPEPSALALSALGFAALLRRRRK